MCSITKQFKRTFLVSYIITNECIVYDNVNDTFIIDRSLFTRCKCLVHALILLIIAWYSFPLRPSNTHTLLIVLCQCFAFVVITLAQIYGFLDGHITSAANLSITRDLQQCERQLHRLKEQLLTGSSCFMHCSILVMSTLIYIISSCLIIWTIMKGELGMLIGKAYLLNLWGMKAANTGLVTFAVSDCFAHINRLLKGIRSDLGRNCNVCEGLEEEPTEIGKMCFKHALSAVKDLYNASLELAHNNCKCNRFRHLFIHALLIMQFGETISVFPKIWMLFTPAAPFSYQVFMSLVIGLMFFLGIYIRMLLGQIEEHAEIGRSIHKLYRMVPYWSDYNPEDRELVMSLRQFSYNIASNDVQTDCYLFHLNMENYGAIVTFALFVASMPSSLNYDWSAYILPYN